MAVTLPDVTLTSGVFVDIYALSGITVGLPLLIQNKGSAGVTIQIKGFQPASSSNDGVLLITNEFCVIGAGETGCWVKGTGKLAVQVMN